MTPAVAPPWSTQVQRALERGLVQLRAGLARYGLDVPEVYVSTEARPGPLHAAHVVVDVGDRRFEVDVAVPDPAELAQRVLQELGAQFDGFRLAANPALRARVAARATRSARVTPIPSAFRDAFQADGLPAVRRAAQHELAALQADGALEPGWVDVDDLVDAAVADVLPELDADVSIDLATVLVQKRVLDLLDGEVEAAAEASRRFVALDPVSPDALDPRPLTGLGADLEALWEVAEPLGLDEVVADPHGIDPEEVAADQELRTTLVHALFQVPGSRRRLFEAVVMDGWQADTVGAGHGLSAADVMDEVEAALDDLVEALSGEIQPPRGLVRAMYVQLGEVVRDEHAADEAAALARRGA